MARWGLSCIRHAARPDGLAQAFVVGRSFVADDPVALVLGDNIFYGHGLSESSTHRPRASGATIFGYAVKDPERMAWRSSTVRAEWSVSRKSHWFPGRRMP